MVGCLAGSCTPNGSYVISSPRWCTTPLTSFDQWCVVSALGAAQSLSWPTVHEMACFLWFWLPLWKSLQIMQLMFQQSVSYAFYISFEFLDRVLDIPGGYLVGDAQCTLCTGPWSSTGPVLGLVLSARCCATTGAVATLLEYTWLDSGYMFCVFTWVRYGRLSHNFYAKAVLRS